MVRFQDKNDQTVFRLPTYFFELKVLKMNLQIACLYPRMVHPEEWGKEEAKTTLFYELQTIITTS
jgi:hypothetical protein